MSASVSLVSLNMEGDKHLGPITPFLSAQKPEVACIQEIFEKDVPLFEELLDAKGVFAPMMRYETPAGRIPKGNAIFSRLPIVSSSIAHYAGGQDELVDFDKTSSATKFATERYVFIATAVMKGEVAFDIGTTHYPWTPDGEADDYQRRTLAPFMTAVDAIGELVFTGDFNAPRGKEIFSALAARYRDNIPPQYETSLDGSLHRAGPLPYMVDGVFSTPRYAVSDVSLKFGVSDHAAVIATVTRL